MKFSKDFKFRLEIGIHKLDGNWMSTQTGHVWRCVIHSNPRFTCNGQTRGTVTWDGATITWDSTGSNGTFAGDYLINWSSGSQWLNQGKRNIIYHNEFDY